MNDLTPQDVAERAGVDRANVLRLIDVGVLISDENGHLRESDVRRVRMVQVLERAGLPIEGIGIAIRNGAMSLDFVETATYDRFASFGAETFRDVSERTGIPIELVMVVREATGAALPSPDDRLREDELPVLPLIELQLANGFRPEVIERALRVYGESLRRVAETEADWWNTEIVVPMLRAGKGWSDIGDLSTDLSPRLSEAADQALLAVYHAQQTNAWMRNILEGVERGLESAGLHHRPDRAPPTICFLDLTGYTRMTEERGDEAAAGLAETLSRMVQRTAAQHGGRPVKWLGDGVMLHFPDPAPGVLAALEMVEATGTVGLPPAHVGLHSGPVLFQEGDYFGRTVNVAARIAGYARPGEVIVSQEVVDVVDRANLAFTAIGPVELKGVSGVTSLYVARRNG